MKPKIDVCLHRTLSDISFPCTRIARWMISLDTVLASDSELQLFTVYVPLELDDIAAHSARNAL